MQKNSLSLFIINTFKYFHYKNQSKKHYADKKRQLCIGKDQLNIG